MRATSDTVAQRFAAAAKEIALTIMLPCIER
jgi:hypothetical protein